METPCDSTDRSLFAACTKISLGNGETAKFWTDKWLNGSAPEQLAPLCFDLASRKNLTVKQALSDGRWLRGLQSINSEEQLEQFVGLWQALQLVQLREELSDSISWTLTADGQYSAKSAFEAQFFGRIMQPHLEQVWKTRTEGKVQHFLSLLLQNRKWMAERLRARGLPHDDYCCLCDQQLETAQHLLLHCPYAKEVWASFQHTNATAFQTATSSNTVCGWWNKLRRGKLNEQKRIDMAISIYIAWHIWKERGRRIFQQEAMPASALPGLIRDDLAMLALAKGHRVEA
jgi:hypothetical protein